MEYNEKVLILVTVRSEDALELLQSSLPDRVLLVRAPEDSPFAVGRFLDHWRPCIGVMMSAWLAPNLVVMSAQVRAFCELCRGGRSPVCDTFVSIRSSSLGMCRRECR